MHGLPQPFEQVDPWPVGGLEVESDLRVRGQPALRLLACVDDGVVKHPLDALGAALARAQRIEPLDESRRGLRPVLDPYPLAGVCMPRTGNVVLLVLARPRPTDWLAALGPTRTDAWIKVAIALVEREPLVALAATQGATDSPPLAVLARVAANPNGPSTASHEAQAGQHRAHGRSVNRAVERTRERQRQPLTGPIGTQVSEVTGRSAQPLVDITNNLLGHCPTLAATRCGH